MKIILFLLQILNIYSIIDVENNTTITTTYDQIHETRKLLNTCNFQYYLEERILEFEYELNFSNIYHEISKHHNNILQFSIQEHVDIINNFDKNINELLHEKNIKLQELDMEKIENCGKIENNLYSLEDYLYKN